MCVSAVAEGSEGDWTFTIEEFRHQYETDPQGLFDSINQALVVGEALANIQVLENCRLLQEQLEQQEIQIQELIDKHDKYKNAIICMAVY
jgi:hypothetical protein